MQQNMPTCFEVSTIIVGDFSNENIYYLCYNICTKISKTILHKSLQRCVGNLLVTVNNIKPQRMALIFQGTRAEQSWVNSQLSLSRSGTIVSA